MGNTGRGSSMGRSSGSGKEAMSAVVPETEYEEILWNMTDEQIIESWSIKAYDMALVGYAGYYPTNDPAMVRRLKKAEGDALGIKHQWWNVQAKFYRDDPLTHTEQVGIKRLEKALANMPKHQGTVYRGIKFDRESTEFRGIERKLTQMESGKSATFRGMTSATMKKSATGEFFGDYNKKENLGQVLFVIQSKSGRDLTGKVSKGFYDRRREQEVLFRSKTRFRTTSVEKTEQPWGKVYGKATRYIVHMEEI